MKLLSLLFFFLITSSCTYMSPSNTKRGNKFYQKNDNGILIYSLSKVNSQISEFSNYALLIKKENYPSTYIYNLNSKYSKEFQKDLEIKYFNSSTLPAGKYYIIEFLFLNGSNDYNFATNIPFEIKEKQITYIGNFESLIKSKHELINDEIEAEQLYNVENLMKDDSIFYYQNFNLPSNIPLNIQVYNSLN